MQDQSARAYRKAIAVDVKAVQRGAGGNLTSAVLIRTADSRMTPYSMFHRMRPTDARRSIYRPFIIEAYATTLDLTYRRRPTARRSCADGWPASNAYQGR